MAAVKTSINSKRKPEPLRHPKAGEALPVYGAPAGSNSYRRTLRARERATIDRALAILGSLLTDGRHLIDSPEAVTQYLRLQFGAEPVEHFAVLFLDAQSRVIAFERLFTGTFTQTAVYPRDVALAALRHNAAGIILAHNHPSGNVFPSQADKALTKTLKDALALVDVRVVDHVIVSANTAQSMADMGLV
ncbi:MAG: JAB domain-containing protein [Acidovorax defluvii]